MRVLHVVSTAQRRGAEIFAADLVRLLSRRQVAQQVAVLWGPASSDVAYESPVSALSGQPGKRSGWIGRVSSLRRLLKTWSPDVIHAHGGDAMKHVVLADPAGRTPVVYRNIGMVRPWATRGVRRRAYSLLMRRAAMIVAVADVVAQETVETFRLPPERVLTLKNGVDTSRLRATSGREQVLRSLSVPEAARVVLAVGSLSWEKDPLGQIEVAARVLAECPTAFFLMVGEGPLREEVRTAIHRRGLDDRVLLLGSRGDIADLLGASDVLMVASRAGGMEGIPATVIEAGLAGVAVVAFDVAGISEVVQHEVTGLLVPPGDISGLAAAVQQVLRDDFTRRKLGTRAREWCLENFDLEKHCPAYLGLYAAVTGPGARRSPE